MGDDEGLVVGEVGTTGGITIFAIPSRRRPLNNPGGILLDHVGVGCAIFVGVSFVGAFVGVGCCAIFVGVSFVGAFVGRGTFIHQLVVGFLAVGACFVGTFVGGFASPLLSAA